MKLNPAPTDMAATLEECFRAVAAEGGGVKAWLAWRMWRAEWMGRLTRARWVADNYREMLPEMRALGEQRDLTELLSEVEHAAAMVALLEDCSDVVRAKSKKPPAGPADGKATNGVPGNGKR